MMRRRYEYIITPNEPYAIKQALVKKLQNDERIKRVSSNTGKRYLSLALIYMEQNNLRAALESYNKGIDAISLLFSADDICLYSKINNSNDTHQQYHQTNNDNSITDQEPYQQIEQDLLTLKKERRGLFIRLIQHTQKFHQSIPTEILSVVFSNLNKFNDLLQCASVCKRWCDIITSFPFFWNKMSSVSAKQSNNLFLQSLSLTDIKSSIQFT
ncbi:hypothetical protein BDA99DRAFT_10199 [Phascolomyces articulosus]|uniref:F-box domain-containing protein n=1 Tax=Phascolomyces articulosus TaxID=60185 RepID=A0AAD5KC31_9FUNG|nr:hypothetical protein BDA99DRAFT_10199 [Phascolomyces articulosus]